MQEDVCVVRVPSTFNNPTLIANYRLKATGIDYALSVGVERSIEVPIYAQRMYVLHDIEAFAAMVSIGTPLICYIGPENREVESLDSVVPGPVGKDDIAREQYLGELFESAKADGFPDRYNKLAEEHGVLEGYDLLKNLN
jgi:hypothetical protein